MHRTLGSGTFSGPAFSVAASRQLRTGRLLPNPLIGKTASGTVFCHKASFRGVRPADRKRFVARHCLRVGLEKRFLTPFFRLMGRGGDADE